MSKLETNQVDPATGTTLTLGTSGDTIAVPSGVTIANSGTATGFGTNTPTFRAYANSNLSLANNADTTLVFDTENFDPQSTFNTSTGRFTPGVSGKYFLYANIRLGTTNDQGIFDIYIKKNSSTQAAARVRGSGTGNIAVQISDLVESDTDDYFYIQIYQATGGSINATSGSNVTYFTGYKIIE
jgi:hypothetical protein